MLPFCLLMVIPDRSIVELQGEACDYVPNRKEDGTCMLRSARIYDSFIVRLAVLVRLALCSRPPAAPLHINLFWGKLAVNPSYMPPAASLRPTTQI